MERTEKFVTGTFTGYYYTHQRSILSVADTLPPGAEHMVRIYRGTLSNATYSQPWDPSQPLESNTLAFPSIENTRIQSSDQSLSGISQPVFTQVRLSNIKVDQPFESGGKSYARLQGQFRGVLEVPNEKSDPTVTDPSVQDPPPVEGTGDDSTTPPNNDPGIVEGNTTVDPNPPRPPYPPSPPIGPNPPIQPNPPIPPVPPAPNPPTREGCLPRGCLSLPEGLFRLLKYLMILLLLLWFMRQCDGCLDGLNSKVKKNELIDCQRSDSLRKDSLLRFRDIIEQREQTIDSLRKALLRNDSLRNFTKKEIKLREELKAFSENIYFYGGTDEVREEYSQTVDKLSEWLVQHPDVRLEVRGFINGNIMTDLGYKRALKVKNLLVEQGIDPDRLTPVDYGNSYPVDASDDLEREGEKQYNRNMRVEFEIIRY